MLILFAAASLFPSQMIGAFSSDAAIIAEGTDYLSIIRFTYLFFCLTMVLTAVLRSTEVVRIALWLSVAALVVNVSLNWVFIFGNLGFPAMGTKGAAIATLISRITEFALLLLYIRFSKRSLKLRPRDFLGIDRQIFADYFRVSLPVIIVAGLWGLNTAMQTAILGHLSSNAIAANSMASNLFLICKTAAVGAAATTNVIIGKTIGAGDMKRLKTDSRTLQVIFLVIGLFSAGVLYVCTEPVLSLYSFSAESASLARQFLHILVFVVIGMSYQMPVNTGIIKGGGDTAYLMKVDIISIWGIVMPLSFFLAFYLKASPAAVVLCLNSDQFFKCIPAFLKVNFGNWTRKLTRS
jgi:putative MATE family efflux protein